MLHRCILCLLLCWSSLVLAQDNPLIGTWKLISVSTTTAEGVVDQQAYGAQPKGYISYLPNGYMLVVIEYDARAKLSGDWQASPMEERAQAFATSIAYAGKYDVTGDTVVHHVEVASIPNMTGRDTKRTFKVNGHRVVLATPLVKIGGVAKVFVLEWERVPN